MKYTKPLILGGLLGLLAFLTLTRQGKDFAATLGLKIMTIAQSGINLIKGFEGFSAVPYMDAMGKSIGYGHFILPHESFTRPITEAEGNALLIKDTAAANSAITKMVKVPLSINQRDALLSLVFNIGAGGFGKSTLLRKLNASDYSGAAEQFSVWSKSRNTLGVLSINNALVKRRAKEKAIFLRT